jgi:hypothetical protein
LDGSFGGQLGIGLFSEVLDEPVVDDFLVNRCGQVVAAVDRVSFWDSGGVDANNVVLEDEGAAAVASKRRKLMLDLMIEDLDKSPLLIRCDKCRVRTHGFSIHDPEPALPITLAAGETR